MADFKHRLNKLIQSKESVLCVGLDPDLSKIPALFKEESDQHTVVAFCKAVIESTLDYCIAYKPNLAFFEALGSNGLSTYHTVLSFIPNTHLIISDAKRGDIGNTAAHYEKAIFGHSRTDAITVNPLMGYDSVEPYGHHHDKAVFALAYTSNSGASDFFTQLLSNGRTLSEQIAFKLAEWDNRLETHIGMVVGATQAQNIQGVLAAHPNACLLIPGIGAQGGSVDDLKKALENHKTPVLINSSRAIIYAGNEAQNTTEWQKLIENAAMESNKALKSITDLYV